MCQQQSNDVVNLARLKKFREKHAEWRSSLNGDDLHSIWKQQSSLLWDYALFLTINEFRKDADRNPTGPIGFNIPVLRLFDSGFAITQSIGIRRLTDPQHEKPTKRVISLKALVDDIRKNREILTRETYLACHNLPFDPAPSKQRFFDNIVSSGQKFSYVGGDTKGPEAWQSSELAHEAFDRLSEITSTSRSRDDLVSLNCFDVLNGKIESCKEIRVVVDKFIAHAADPLSRTEKSADQIKVTLDRLGECHKAMFQVANSIGCTLLQDSISTTGLPTPQFNLFENLDKAWIEAASLGNAQEYWTRHADQIASWSDMLL